MANNGYDNSGNKISSITTSTSQDEQVVINRTKAGTCVTHRDLNTGKITTENYLGDSPYGN
jgi:hypothetical protein